MFRRLHRKVWLWTAPGIAVQVYRERYLSLGIHIDFARPYVDLHILWLIVSLGRQPWLTDARDRHRHSCRGFLFADDPIL